MSYQNYEAIARLTVPCELKETAGGVKYVSNTLAIDNGDKEKTTSWIPVVFYDKLAEIVSKYCAKGDLVHVNGVIKTRQYETKSGDKASSFSVIAKTVTFLQPKKEKESVQTEQSDDDFIPF